MHKNNWPSATFLVRIKFIYSEKTTKFCKISTLLLSVCTVDKNKEEISQNILAFSEYTNFNVEYRVNAKVWGSPSLLSLFHRRPGGTFSKLVKTKFHFAMTEYCEEEIWALGFPLHKCGKHFSSWRNYPRSLSSIKSIVSLPYSGNNFG